MNITYWKSQCPSSFRNSCGEIEVDDALIDWVDIMFEQIGNASGCPPHTHTWFEFNYVLTGEMVTKFGNRAVKVKAGEYFLVPPGMIHSHQYTRGNPHEGLCLRWRMRRRQPDASGRRGASADGGRKPETSFYRRLLRLKELQPGAYAARPDIREQLLYFIAAAASGDRPAFAMQLMLAGLLDTLAASAAAPQPLPGDGGREQGAPYDSLVRKVEIYMEDFSAGKWKMTDLAASLHMSYGHLARLYKERTGLTLVERMNQIRLAKARALLEQPELLIREVAERACYPDIYYFSKMFKQAYGLSPLQYRKRLLRTASDRQTPDL